MRVSVVLVLLGLLLAAALPAVGQARLEARLEPRVAGVDEIVTLTIAVEAHDFWARLRRPEIELENLEQLAGPFRSREERFVDGEYSRTITWVWKLRPLSTGRAAVRSIVVPVGDEYLELPSQEIEVQAEPTGAAPADPLDRLLGHSPLGGRLWPRQAPPRPRGPLAFIDATVSPPQPYVGQQVLYTVHLYTRGDISAIQPRSLPDFEGFWVRDLPQPEHLPTEMVEVEGERYGRVVLLQKALFALRPGEHRLEPTEMDVLARVTEQRFFGPRMSVPEQLNLRTDPLRLDVRPLPPAPPGFAGTVGDLSLDAELAPADLRVGEAATLSVTLSGRGNLEGVAAPEPPPVAGVQVFPPEQRGDSEVRGTEIHGERSWTWAVVPKRPGEYRLELPEIRFFDPETGSYRVASTAPLALSVTRAPAATARAAGTPADLHGIRSAVLPAGAGRSWRDLLPWLFGLPWALGLAVVLARRRTAAGPLAPPAPGAARPAGAAGGAARRQAVLRLRRAAEEPRPRRSAAEIEAVWRDILAERWGVPAATPAARWAERAAARGADPKTAAELAALADDVDYLRHAPQLSAADSLQREAVERSLRLLTRLR